MLLSNTLFWLNSKEESCISDRNKFASINLFKKHLADLPTRLQNVNKVSYMHRILYIYIYIYIYIYFILCKFS